jgi:hypothetical protein
VLSARGDHQAANAVSPRAVVATSEPAHCGVPDGSASGFHAASTAGAPFAASVSRDPTGIGVALRTSGSHVTGSFVQAARVRQATRANRDMAEDS